MTFPLILSAGLQETRLKSFSASPRRQGRSEKYDKNCEISLQPKQQPRQQPKQQPKQQPRQQPKQQPKEQPK